MQCFDMCTRRRDATHRPYTTAINMHMAHRVYIPMQHVLWGLYKRREQTYHYTMEFREKWLKHQAMPFVYLDFCLKLDYLMECGAFIALLIWYYTFLFLRTGVLALSCAHFFPLSANLRSKSVSLPMTNESTMHANRILHERNIRFLIAAACGLRCGENAHAFGSCIPRREISREWVYAARRGEGVSYSILNDITAKRTSIGIETDSYRDNTSPRELIVYRVLDENNSSEEFGMKLHKIGKNVQEHRS